MSDDIRLAVIGCGEWGQNHCRVAHELGVLAAVCDAQISVADKMTMAFPGIWRTDLPGQCFEVDYINAVVIATPASTHYDLTMQALRAGKHVLVEKPMALRHSEAREMAQLAQESGLLLLVGHVVLYHPAFRELEAVVCSTDEFGDIRYIYSNRLNYGKVRTHEDSLWSFAPHDFAMILRLVGGRPDHVSAYGGDYITPGVADMTVTHLEWLDGTRAHVHVSWLHPFKEHRLVVVGEHMTAMFDGVAGSVSSWVNDDNHVDRLPVVTFHPSPEPLRAELQDFLTCIKTGGYPNAGHWGGVHVMDVLERADKSLHGEAICK